MLTTIRKNWQQRETLGDDRFESQQLDFLPAALEIKERPPHPVGRITAWLLISLFTIGVIWACFGQVNIVAVAEGKIVPQGQVKLIQPYEKGVVAEILVHEGQRVKAGTPLIILDRSQTQADQVRLEQELRQNRLNSTRIEGLLNSLQQSEHLSGNGGSVLSSPLLTMNADQSGLIWPENSTPIDIANQQALLLQQLNSYNAENARLDEQIEDKRAEQRVNAAVIAKLRGTLPLITQRVDALKSLLDRKMAARVQFLELEQERVEQQHDLQAALATNQQLAAQQKQLEQQRNSLLAQTQQDNLQQLIELNRQQASLQEELNKAQDLNKKQVLEAPVDGIVQELAIHTIGGVVTPAQQLMKLVPESQQLVVEAWLENKDIGFVEAGQPAEIKIHTFPFTKYGIIEAEVDNVSSDATADENRGLIYKARILMAKSSLWVEGKEVALVPGMSVSAEVKTGKRYLIEYILTPLLRYKSESVRER
ncbi:HlyD family type I secretion periplasmic adaptor subunit [Amphritea pacifica]|uniref:HlyD family type I secretion periplasmic adaptor subunit n=1 Tax=Amphritea pacifica TaxID=2811233 RepID=UPI0019646F81|nr:HlyD family type I secretion periplasmic adaptor subunit [Amphritea pacifica]MBN1006598.1 HlyD family type I secretion periplasmic adaptor subunit [Amphritea pacifica]